MLLAGSGCDNTLIKCWIEGPHILVCGRLERTKLSKTTPRLSITYTPETATLQSELPSIVLAPSLTSGKYLFASEVSYAFEGTTLLKLTRDTLVDTILHGIDVLVSRNLGLVEIIYFNS